MKALLALAAAALVLALTAADAAAAERRKKSMSQRSVNTTYRAPLEPQRRFNPDPSPSAVVNQPYDTLTGFYNPFDYRLGPRGR